MTTEGPAMKHLGLSKMIPAAAGQKRCYGDDPKCGTYDPHECPFASEIHDDKTPCQCCDKCAYECAMDV